MNHFTSLLITTLVVFWAPLSYGQEGVVTYEEHIKLELDLPEEVIAMGVEIPDSRTSTKALYFNENESLLKSVEEDDASESHELPPASGVVVRVQRDVDDNQSYTNFETGETIEKRDFLGRTFLIKGEMESLPWKLTSERSEFLGYMCQKATAVQDSTTYEAWFTPEISIPAGPGQGGLPGLILVLTVDDGMRSYVAKEVALGPVEQGIISPPSKGKKVTREEYDEIVEERMEEMGGSGNGNGRFIIRVDN